MVLRYLIVLILIIFLYPYSSATIINIPADWPTIQQGIDASTDGDTVLVQPGTYVENINFNGHNIVLGSLYLTTGDTSYISTTILDGGGSGPVLILNSAEDSTALITGFTIQNGLASYGGGIYLNNANPIIKENIIKSNNADRGGGVYCNNSSPIIISNKIESNEAFGPEWMAIGGGISCDGNSAPVINRNNIINNSAYGNYGGQGGGIDISYYCNPVVLNNILNNNSALNGGAIYDDGHTLFKGNLIINNNGGHGGGVFFDDNYSIFTNNTVSGNEASWNGGGLYFNNAAEITNNIIWGNAAQEGYELSIHSGNPSITYCNIRNGFEGIGNINSDPLFTDPNNDNFDICQQSPCLDAGDPTILDPDSTRSDIGVFFPDHINCNLGNIWYVSVTGNDSTGNGSMGNPFRTIQHTVNGAFNRDTIIVSNGTYIENVNIEWKSIFLASNYQYSQDSIDIYNTIIDGDSAGTAVTFKMTDSENSAIKGFTIQNGAFDNVGGIYCYSSNSIISNNIIQNNHVSGVLCYSSNSIIRNNIIKGNSDYGNLSLGGAIECWYCDPIIDSNIIIDNYTALRGGGIYCNRASPIISNNYICNNSSPNGGALHIYYYSNPVIKNNVIRENSSDIGAGIDCLIRSNPIIADNIISENVSNYGGGALYLYNRCSPLISNSIIANNDGGLYGGAVYINLSCSPIFINSQIFGNSVDSIAGGIYVRDSSDIIIENSILRADSANYGQSEIFVGYHSTMNVSYSNIQGGWPGEGNIDLDPLFRDPENGDFHLMSIACGDSADSPCIDAGDPNILDSLLHCSWGLGEPRSDMGAYGGGDSLTTAVFENLPPLPNKMVLLQNYPNPFNAQTTIRFILPESDEVKLMVYDLLGRRVTILADNYMAAGAHSITFDASEISSGVYFYRLQAGDRVETKRMLLLK